MSVKRRNTLKAELLKLADQTNEGFDSSDPVPGRIKEIIEEIITLSPIEDPIDRPEKVRGRWKTRFSSVGTGAGRSQHGKSVLTPSSLKHQSFSRLPDVPINIVDGAQEIDPDTYAYNNVIEFVAGKPEVRGAIYVRGSYDEVPDNRKRFIVNFYRVEVHPRNDLSMQEFKKALGLKSEDKLAVKFPSPQLYSDVVYLDNQLRINIGSLGGYYVLTLEGQQMESVA